MRNNERAFSLIEVLIVVAIIGTLASIVMYGITGSREKGRDTARIADLETLNLSLLRYFEACREYPSALTTTANNGCPSGTTLGSFIPAIPADPLGASYGYSTSGAGNGYDAYVVRAELETGHAVLVDDVDGSTNDGVTLECDDSPQFYYCIGP